MAGRRFSDPTVHADFPTDSTSASKGSRYQIGPVRALSTPISPPSGPTQWLFQGPPAESKLLAVAGEAWFNVGGAAADLAPYSGTAYFLDFETIGSGVPIWKGTRPYQQLPFQFSLHIVSPSGEMNHKEFLDLSGEDPSEAFARALIDHCGTTGPVFVYNAGFENGVMRGLANRFPLLATDLHAIIARVVDLLPIARNRYYHPDQHGSWSIKAVLPAVCPDLTYDSLDGVQHGQAAQGAFLEAMAPGTTPERKAEIERQLLAYCKLDTLAMVRLWEFFRGEPSR